MFMCTSWIYIHTYICMCACVFSVYVEVLPKRGQWTGGVRGGGICNGGGGMGGDAARIDDREGLATVETDGGGR